MNNVLVRRLAQLVPMLFFISLVSFLLVKLAPGDPVQAYITPRMSPEDIERIRHSLGLDKPMFMQYLLWLKNVLQGDLGYSLIYHRPVLTMIAERIPATLGLMGASLVLAMVVAIPLGLLAGAYKHRWLDHFLNMFAYIGISVPIFWFGILLITVFSVQLNWLPSMGMRTIGVEDSWLDVIRHGILPCIALSFYNLSNYVRYIRSNTITQLSADYVQTQLAYGATRRTILFRHVLKNVLLPVITLFGLSFGELVVGAYVTESVFSWPGMGLLGIQSITSLDYPLIMAMIMLSSTMLIIGNLLADLLYRVADPRIKALR
ncbi:MULTISPECIES: ABC transporter permease [Buttiauxella]|jgi:peptide/nickel transport system permease protein|uniref:Oligopeptide transport system permease protein n=1 Tax=Buttiauxella ferragutiae ATCC 51602 TaxID=1354252 RepID=A0ABX2W6M8_9ENTR|nr:MULTISPECIES: ABC transporter permease [Buttiauxella]AYN26499.1 ABC transporter permease [Buttiauxella sp. 3AFRM03]MCE0828688.1 ABC transporter permease [Buttiauxella ferragutiae]OAT26591.1 oligopeptide transport system permease protein [Buttiauxella ferragutiae ATCC 51602]TDN54781.1 peptide/nickel transport system permease protein [Buttiauxella sp. JUb87]UNK63265.1 ABC transporter permease [Buttiauxella ferragutiae]